MIYDVLHGLLAKFFPVFPFGAVFSVTNRCNARCKMCNIWRTEKHELPIEKFIEISANRLFSRLVNVALTGGEPTLRDDLHLLIDHLFRHSTRLMGINLTTNALAKKRLASIVEQLLDLRDRHRPEARILVQISLDGPGEIHDTIRGVPGAFNAVMESSKILEDIAQKTKNFDFYYLCVLQPANIPHLSQLSRFFESLGRRVVFNPLNDASYIMPNDGSPRLATADEAQIVEFLKRQLSMGIDPLMGFHYKQIISWLTTGLRRQPCGVTDQHIIVTDDGRIIPCLNNGNLRFNIQNPAKELTQYWKSRDRRIIKKELKTTVCPHCRAFCGPNTFDALLAHIQLALTNRWNKLGTKVR
jgi:MoaA/NifB/PqqE/SkfB family radical SAM enzyme